MGNHKEEIATTYKVVLFNGGELPENYTNFILARWLRSFRYGNDYIKLTDSDSYFLAYKRYLDSILKGPKVTIRLAVLSDEPDVALGFSVVEDRVLHYVYVGSDYRGQRIGTHLVPIKVEAFTHLTKNGLRIWATKAPMAKFNPFH